VEALQVKKRVGMDTRNWKSPMEASGEFICEQDQSNIQRKSPVQFIHRQIH